MSMSPQTLATWCAIVAAIGGAIFNYAVLNERSEKNRTTIEEHEKRLDIIERDQTTADKLKNIEKSLDYLGWKVGALEEQLKKGKR